MDNKYRDAGELTVKTIANEKGVSAFIKNALNDIPEGKALAMADLVKDLQAQFPNVPNKHQAYTRINNVLSREFGKQFVKLEGTDGYTYISKI